MKVIIFILAVVVCGAMASNLSEKEIQEEFLKFMHKYGKTYTSVQFKTKYSTFRKNLQFINLHNSDRTKIHQVAVNSFADLSSNEFQRYYLGLKAVDMKKHQEGPQFDATGVDAAPETWDWRTKRVVSAVKNQGQCGSCWSFSTTGSTEACHAIRYGAASLVSLSEQNLIDCSASYGNQGCNGGLMTDAMDYIIANKGLDTEKSYPYQTAGPLTCQYDATNLPTPVASLSSYVNVVSGDEKALQQAGVKGPVSVAIDASQSSFQFYSTGVYYEPDCSSSSLDHGVLMVGWGKEGTSDFWWVKNSWGADWGLQGYIKMARNHGNNCGIATMATLPVCA